MDSIKRILLRKIYSWPKGLRHKLYNFYDYFKYSDTREEKKSYGEDNKEKTFYVIRPYPNSNEGLMSLLLNVCRQIIYAEEKQYIPVVDFQNYPTQYSESEDNNVWKEYFEQPSGFDLDEVYHSRNVVLSGLKPTRENIFEPETRFRDKEMLYGRQLISRYIHVNENVRQKLKKEMDDIDPSNCIGLYLRGTDYLTLRPIGHCIQPNPEEAMDVVEEYLKKYNAEFVYLVTEDFNIYHTVRKHFSDKLKIASFDRFIEDYGETEYLFRSPKLSQISDSKYERGLYYLLKILLLAECKCFVAGNTCGSWAASAFSNGIIEPYIFDLGKFK